MRPPVAEVGVAESAFAPPAVIAYATLLIGIRGVISPSPLTSVVRKMGWLKSRDVGKDVTDPS